MEEEKSRLEHFKDFVELDPNDAFSRYALGMEYLGVSEFHQALQQFETVIQLEPENAAAYFQAGLSAKKLQDIPRARQLLARGIEVAERKGDWHARDEMREALELIDTQSA